MKNNVLKEKSFGFALKIITLSKHLQSQKEFVISNQILKSGTAIGALTREAEHAESSADFKHKLDIALKESNETQYWLELLFHSKQIDDSLFNELNNESIEILKILTAILKTLKFKST